jgi:hypothetical protein
MMDVQGPSGVFFFIGPLRRNRRAAWLNEAKAGSERMSRAPKGRQEGVSKGREVQDREDR